MIYRWTEAYKNSRIKRFVVYVSLCAFAGYAIGIAALSIVSKDNRFPAFTAMLCFVLLGLLMALLLKINIKTLRRNLDSLYYETDTERLIINCNNYAVYTITKNEVETIKRYKNGLIEFNLANQPKAFINPHIDNYEGLVKDIEGLHEITVLPGNRNTVLNVITGVASVLVLLLFYSSQNIPVMVISGTCITTYSIGMCIYYRTNKHIDPKTRKTAWAYLCFILIVMGKVVDML